MTASQTVTFDPLSRHAVKDNKDHVVGKLESYLNYHNNKLEKQLRGMSDEMAAIKRKNKPA